MLEAKLILAKVLQRFSVQILPGQSMEPEWGITLRPKSMNARVSPRKERA